MAIPTHLTRPTFVSLWGEVIGRNSDLPTEDLVSSVRDQINTRLSLGYFGAGEVCQQILEVARCHRNMITKCHESRLCLLEAVDILATWRVDQRPLVRAVLTELYHISQMLDREIFFLTNKPGDHTYGPTSDLLELGPVAREKLMYMLGHVGGWRLTPLPPWNRSQPDTTYLDLPFCRADGEGVTMLLSDVLYKLRDSDLVLLLLRYGVKPCAMLLWPITIQIDLKQTLRGFFDSSGMPRHLPEAILNHETACMKYFCRARNNFTIYVQRTITSEGRRALDMNVSMDDLLLMPDHVTIEDYIPDDRWRHPASLMQQSRLAIRKAIYLADAIPEGIQQLPLPKLMKNYVDLLMD